jgi:hypothetical protein
MKSVIKEFTVGQVLNSDNMTHDERVALFGEEVTRALEGPQDGKGRDVTLRVIAVDREAGTLTIGEADE